MTAGEVSVHFIFPGTISQDMAVACLTKEEITRAGRFRFPKDEIHWAACRASLREILGHYIQRPPCEVPIVLSEYGKPLLAPPYDLLNFNLSHSLDLAVVAVCHDDPVGIDLESLDRAPALLECEATFCHPEELRSLQIDIPARISQLLHIWTAKEAVLKALGTGLSHPPESVQILFQQPYGIAISDRPLAGIEEQCLYELHHPVLSGYRAVLSASLAINKIRMINGPITL